MKASDHGKLAVYVLEDKREIRYFTDLKNGIVLEGANGLPVALQQITMFDLGYIAVVENIKTSSHVG